MPTDLRLAPGHSRRSFLKKGLLGGSVLALGGAGLLLSRHSRRVPIPTAGLKVLDELDFAVLCAITRRIVPDQPGKPSIESPDVALNADRILVQVGSSAQAEVKQLLKLFENALTGFVFGLRVRPFTQLSDAEQDAVLSEWENSRLLIRRTGFQAIRTLVVAAYYGSSASWPATGYPGPPAGFFQPDAALWLGGPEKRPVGEGRIYRGEDVQRDLKLDCDVCVIGSGAGGSVLAHELVSRGLSVVMLEEGGYHTRREFDLTESRAFPNLYQDLGNRTTDDLSIGILQGRSVGGGTTVNWCSSFRTPPRILERWRDAYGVEGLSEQVLRPHFEAIEERLHIAQWPEERINRNNRILWDGLGKLGYGRGLIARNVNNCANLGYCGMGCPIDAKQSMLVTLIPDAVEKGLSVYANASVRNLRVTGRKVSAVEAEIVDVANRPLGPKLTVKSKLTAVCCGALNSPALLLRSGLDGNGRVGRRTFLHPVVVMVAEFEEPVEGFFGAPQSVHSHHFIDRGPDRIGFFIEVPPIHPMLAATTFTGFGRRFVDSLSRLPFINVCIALTVDGLLDGDEGGTVGLRGGTDRRLRIEYPLRDANWEAFRTACKEMARIQFAAGAKRVISLHSEPVVLRSEAELFKLDAAPWEKLRVRVVTAHQMGGCAMGRDFRKSVVDSQLRYHHLDNLFVVDGSVFPTSLGVNPQETIYAIARWGANHLASAV